MGLINNKMERTKIIIENFRASITLKEKLVNSPEFVTQINSLAEEMLACFRRKNKVLFCGNGGSAADAQHLSAELSGRYNYDRPPLPAQALHVNTSYLTAVANDYSFAEVYARLLHAIGKEGDILIGLSTSGNSENIRRAFEEARALGITTIGFTGAGGGRLRDLTTHLLEIPSTNVPRIQECHMLIGHTLCHIIESALFPLE